MPLSLSLPTSLEYFASLVQSDDHFPLLEAAASLAQDEYPELDVQQPLGDMDQLLARIQRRLPADAPALLDDDGGVVGHGVMLPRRRGR